MSTNPKTRLYVFRVLIAALPIVFFLAVEAGLRLVDYGPDLDLFVPFESDAAYMMTNPDVAKRYFSRVGRTPRPPYELFLAEKPSNGYRVFIMGGSTVAGWPYPENAMASRILDQRLQDAFPDRVIEVVNVGIAAVNSFTLRDLVPEILDQDPDAILIYAGHNEYFGALGAASTESLGSTRWIVNTYLELLHFRTVRALRDLIGAVGSGPAATGDAGYEETYPTLMSRMIAGQVLYESDAYRRGAESFAGNLDDILRETTGAGVRVIVSELVSNLRDMPPLASVASDAWPPADLVFEQARALEREGSYDAARNAYETARDLDALRFRAPGEFNAIIHEVAGRYGVPVVPMQAYFEAASPNGLIGAGLMLEHLHPNVEGQLLMADAFFRTMREQGFIAEDWGPPVRTAAWYAANWPVTDLDRALGRLRVMDLMDYWPFRPLDAPGDAFRTFVPASPAEAMAYRVTKGEIDFVQAHIDLAGIYQAAGDEERAAREYAALDAADPAVGFYDAR